MSIYVNQMALGKIDFSKNYSQGTLPLQLRFYYIDREL